MNSFLWVLLFAVHAAPVLPVSAQSVLPKDTEWSIHLRHRDLALTGLQLFDAQGNTKIADLTNGMVLYVSEIPSMASLSFSIMAAFTGSDVKSVRFGWNDNASYKTENTSPFCLCGNKGADVFACPALGLGTHTVTATSFASKRARGTASVPYTVTFTIAATRPSTLAPVRRITNAPASPTSAGPPTTPVVGAPLPVGNLPTIKPPTNAPKPPTMAPIKPPTKVPTKAPTKRPTKRPTSAPIPVITLDLPLLSDSQVKSVRDWMQNKTIQLRTEFCWKNTYDRGIGLIPDGCPSGKEKIGALCYSKCPAGYSRFGFDCHANEATYTRGGYEWQLGDCPFCTNGIIARCEKDHGSGNCEVSGLVAYPKCRSGYNAVGCCVCGRPNPILIGDPTPMTCRPDQANDAGLCYAPCANTHYGVAFLCWTKCETGLTDCGAACAKDSPACVDKVVDQVLAPVMMAANVVTFGLAKKAASGVEAAAVAIKTATGATELVIGVTKLGLAFVDLIQSMKKSRQTRKVKKVTQRKDPNTGEVKRKEEKEEDVDIDFVGIMEAYLDAYVEDFGTQTHPVISSELDKRFHRDTAKYFKRMWATEQLQEMAKYNEFDTQQFVLDVAAIVDPTGILDLALAYANPVCQSVAPFPI